MIYEVIYERREDRRNNIRIYERVYTVDEIEKKKKKKAYHNKWKGCIENIYFFAKSSAPVN